jgi:serine/threonine protein kinase/tetratricopeptide (TPR) repeat protein
MRSSSRPFGPELEGPSERERAQAFAHALTSRRGPPGTPGSLDVAYDRLMGDLRLFPPTDDSPRKYIYVKDFRIETRIGSGGMASVYLAWSPSFECHVALKILFDFDEAQNDERALQEARCLARVGHPNIVHVYEVEGKAPWCIATPQQQANAPSSGWTAVIVMEYVDGLSLEAWLARPRPWRTIVSTFLQVARGLAEAHRCGLLHRDVTPRNILVRTEPEIRVTLVDFGLSRVAHDTPSDSRPNAPAPPPDDRPRQAARPRKDDTTASGSRPSLPLWAPELVVDVVCGTPGYSAPEQLAVGNTIDARSDVFGLCASMWHALADQLPYDPAVLRPGTTVEARVPLSIRRASWPRHLPSWLCELLIGGLAVEREHRPPSMTGLLRAVERRLARPQQLIRWIVVPLASIAATIAIAVALFYRPAHAPFGRGHAGIDAVWSAEREQALASAVADAAPTLRDAWSELHHAIGEYAATWERIRGTIAASSEWTGEMQRHAGECLLAARGEFDQVLRAIGDAAASADDTADLGLRIHRWILALRPPAVCRSPRYAIARAARTPDRPAPDPAWQTAYTLGYQHFLEGRLEDATLALTAAMSSAANDPGARARVHFRLGLVDLASSRSDASIAHFHDTLRLTADGSDPYLQLHTLTNLMITGDDPNAALGWYAEAQGHLADTFADDPAAVHEEAGNLHVRAAWAVGRAEAADRFVRCPIDCAELSRPLASCGDVPAERRASQCAEDLLALAEAGDASFMLTDLIAKTRAEHLLEHGELAEAERVAQQAVDRDDPRRPATGNPMLYEVLGRAQLLRGRNKEAELNLRRALTAHEARGQADRAPAFPTLHLLSGLADHRDDLVAARDLGERARPILERLDRRSHVPEAVELYARLGGLYLGDPPIRDEVLGRERLRRGLERAEGATLDAAHTEIVRDMREQLAELDGTR